MCMVWCPIGSGFIQHSEQQHYGNYNEIAFSHFNLRTLMSTITILKLHHATKVLQYFYSFIGNLVHPTNSHFNESNKVITIENLEQTYKNIHRVCYDSKHSQLSRESLTLLGKMLQIFWKSLENMYVSCVVKIF